MVIDIKDRVKNVDLQGKIVTAYDAAQLINPNDKVGISGFTPSGYAKVVPLALAERMEKEPFKIDLWTGASVGDEADGALTRANGINRRFPYQTNKDMRKALNSGDVKYIDMHLSTMAQNIRYGFFGDLDVAIIEVCQINEDGSLVPTTSVGNSPTFVSQAKKVIVEVNVSQPLSLVGMHDIYEPLDPPHRKPIPLEQAGDRIGTEAIPCDPSKIIAVVPSDVPDTTRPLAAIDDDAKAMSQHLIKFFEQEIAEGRLPKNLLPLQSGVGSVANAVISGLAQGPFTDLSIYTEVIQDGMFDLIDAGKVTVCSGTALSPSPDGLKRFYANIDEFDASKYELEYDKLPVMDKWLLSKLNTLTKTVDEHLANYRIPESARALQDFVDDMSNWYVRRSRERFWAKGMEQDKINAYMTLYTALVTVSKVAAPMIPFMTEEIYQNLVKSVDASAPESIHLCDYPEVQNELIDEKLEADMDNVLKLVVMGRACRNASNIKNRQPIGQMFVKAGFDLPEFYQEIVADELNVKNVKFTDDVRDFTSYSFKPQLKTVGPKYGKMLGGIKAALDQLDGNAAMDEINETGSLKLDINGQEVTLFKEDLLIDTAQIEGYVSENDNGITVVLDTNLTEELLEEGFVREIISKIQTMRKEAGFEVMDKIKVTYKGSEKAEAVFAANGTQICSEVLAVSAEKAEPAGFVKEWKINGEAVFMGVEKEGR